MRRMLVGVIALLVGCHDFDALVAGDGGHDSATTPPDLLGVDLVGADLTGPDLTGADLTGVDTAMPPEDLVGADLFGVDLFVNPPFDLARDVPPPTDLGGVCPTITLADPIYVTPGSPGGDGTKSNPYHSIGAAVGAAQSLGTFRNIAVAEGEYTESVTINQGMAIYGGWDTTFACAHHGTTKVVAKDDGKAAFTIDGSTGEVTLQHLRIVGKATGSPSIGVLADTTRVRIVDSVVTSHDPLSATAAVAHAVKAERSRVTIHLSQLGGGTASAASRTLDVCSSGVTVSDSTIDNTNGSGSFNGTVVQFPDCDPVAFPIGLTFERSILYGSGTAPCAVYTGSSHLTTFLGTAIFVEGTSFGAKGFEIGGSFDAPVDFIQSTMSVPNGWGFVASGAMTVALENSIVSCDIAFSNGAGGASAVNLPVSGKNILRSASDIMIYAFTNLSVADYPTDRGDMTSLYGPAGLDFDGIHIDSMSDAQGEATACATSYDFDGDPRPGFGSGTCDIGADEAP